MPDMYPCNYCVKERWKGAKKMITAGDLQIYSPESLHPKKIGGFFFIVTFDLAKAKTDFHVLRPSVKRG